MNLNDVLYSQHEVAIFLFLLKYLNSYCQEIWCHHQVKILVCPKFMTKFPHK